ncbi:MAG: bifunctional transaldolase/phosoglucose isomerase [Acidisphaera sp.]|nr:bifunctional transaldolase/phosoglucose isomerase [Acidisphaera sp.]
MNPLQQLPQHGQSVWLDFVSRSLLDKGELQRLVEEDDLRGVTSNPSIFEKAIGHSHEYDADLTAFQREGDQDVAALFEHLAVTDIRHAADVLRPVYERTGRVDGYISLEVSPYLALKTEDTVAEARRLWKAVGRENLMIKVPGTAEGGPAIRTLISEGINVNVTLLFSTSAYRTVAEAYMDGLETFAGNGGDVSRVASVASFFVSRIDTSVEKAIDAKLKDASAADAALLLQLRSKVAIANAKLAYQLYKELLASPRWQALSAKGARPQRLLWASTGTKSKDLPDTIYVDELIGPDTVNTMPPATMDAVRDHGHVADTLETDIEGARATMALLERVGISMERITNDLVTAGVQQFADAADALYEAVARRRAEVLDGATSRQTITLGDKGLEEAVAAEAERWRHDGLIRRLWAGDKTLWSGADEDKWTGWLGIVEQETADLDTLRAFGREVQEAGYTDVVLLGMGGSSLGPEVLAETFGHRKGWPHFHMLDSTDPAQVRAIEAAVTLPSTLFIVSSKSGSTLEPNIFKQYFFGRMQQTVDNPGKHFVAVTDPGSAMEKAAGEAGFAHIFHGVKSIGGRYSVLSKFGMVPAATMGIDMAAFLRTTQQMVRSCGPYMPPSVNPGVALGLAMGVLAREGRDKVTLIASPGIGDIGAWLEQLMAESTGKQGKGLIPVAAEPLGPPEVYGRDRLFVYLELDDGPDPGQRDKVEALEKAGQPVVRIRVKDKLHIGQEFFRWEMATAVAGAVIGINPFDQPDVEASKVKTRELTDAYEKTGSLPEETPIFRQNGTALYADQKNAAALGRNNTLQAYLKAHFDRIGAGDYAALLAYIQRDEANTEALQAMREKLRDGKRVATVLGFGPRFLHSTGQAYKGGPNSGVFLQITCDDAQDLAVPGQKYGFSLVKAAQARGDFDVLAERGRRALRVHLGSDLQAGLRALGEAIDQALA